MTEHPPDYIGCLNWTACGLVMDVNEWTVKKTGGYTMAFIPA